MVPEQFFVMVFNVADSIEQPSKHCLKILVVDDDDLNRRMSVLLTTSNNEEIRQRTVNGITVFDMTGYPPGLGITVSLPGLYRSESLTLPEQGEVLVTFMFEQPVLPTSLP